MASITRNGASLGFENELWRATNAVFVWRQS